MIEASKNFKISIYVNFSDVENEIIDDICVALLQGKYILRAKIFGSKYDLTDSELKKKIMSEEMDEEFYNEETFKFGIEKIETNIHEMCIESIFDVMKKFKNFIMANDGSSEYDEQYVIYNDNYPGENSNFFYKLCDYIENNDDTITPLSFKDIFISSSDIKSLFSSYGYDDIPYTETSPMSNAIFIGIALDFSLGYR